MESTIEKIDEIIVFTVPYQALDAKTAKEFREEFNKTVAENATVLIDLCHVEFVDSAGLGAIVALLKGLRASGGDLRICNVHKPVRALFELVRMHRLVEVFNDRAEALA